MPILYQSQDAATLSKLVAAESADILCLQEHKLQVRLQMLMHAYMECLLGGCCALKPNCAAHRLLLLVLQIARVAAMHAIVAWKSWNLA